MPFSSDDGRLLRQNDKQFDFNISFEQVFFSILPSALFVASSLWRILHLRRKTIVVNAPIFRLLKEGAVAVYVVLELTLLVFAAARVVHITSLFLTASVIRFLTAFSIGTLSTLEHSRNPRPSILLNSYLILTLLLDATQARTLYLSSSSHSEHSYSIISNAAVAWKAVLLTLESKQKSKWVGWNEKDHSPEETSGIVSLGVFFWLNNLFWKGYKKVMVLDDLYALDSTFDPEKLHSEFSRNLGLAKLKGDKFGLTKVLLWTLKVPLLLPVIPRLGLLGFTFAQPFFIESLLDYLAKDSPDVNTGYGFIGASLFIYAGTAFCWAFHRYYNHRMRTIMRSMLVTEIFVTATKAKIGTSDDSIALTLMSTDIERIKIGFRDLHDVWASIIQVGLSAWMLNKRLGVVFVAPIGVVILCFVGLVILMNFIGNAQTRWMASVQKRVSLTATVITSMKNLKISGLAPSVAEFIQNLRVEELVAGAMFRKIWIGAATLGFIPLLISPALAFAFTQKELDASVVFTSLSFLTLLTIPLSQIFQSIPELISGIACIGRIQAFLECETHDDFRQFVSDISTNSDKASPEDVPIPKFEVIVRDGSFAWESGKVVLEDVNIKLPRSTLTLVVGPVGSGKSTLCKALLGEIPCHTGAVILNNRIPHVGFCDQTPFLSNGSIKENIIVFSPFDTQRYAEIISATALTVDLANLPLGDDTNMGSDGISLSGGQKQRVALARALYLQTDLLILDDVFSGLDAETEAQVFRQVFAPEGLLRRRGSTVLLCTHSVQHLPSADYVISLDNGKVAAQGTFAEVMPRSEHPQQFQAKSSSDSESSPDVMTTKAGRSGSTTLATRRAPVVAPLAQAGDASRRVGDRTVYEHYMKSMGWFLSASALFFAALWGFFLNYSTIWLTYWVDDIEAKHTTHTHAYWAVIYALLQVGALVSLVLLGASICVVSIKRAGARIHYDILRTLFRAPLHFSTATDTGVVTNYFSQDLNLIDTELPDATVSTLFTITQVVGQMAVMLTSSRYLAIAFPFLIALLYVVQRFYLRTSRQLRLLDLEAKSPLYTHFLDIVRGISTLRAFGFVLDDLHKNALLLRLSQRPSYLLLMIQEWLTIVLNLVVMLLAVTLTSLAVRLHSDSAFAGAAMYSLLSFGKNLTGIVFSWTKLETALGAIARLKTFNETVESEDKDDETVMPSEDWPQHGVIEFKGVSASYGSESQEDSASALVLRDINLAIGCGQKVAICGRTGSGKSSLIGLLLKLLSPTSATARNVVIDNIPLHLINRSVLRQRIIAMPQEAVFLPDGSTFRANIDVSNEGTLEGCDAVLETVGLRTFVEERGGLDASMSASTFSAGQRQLMSLARALLRKLIRGYKFGVGSSSRGILLLDEVSSSVDRDTERVMQEIIRTKFEGYTVIAVSHRLEMIMDFDKVVVMAAGEIVEVGSPTELASKANSKFGNLLRASK